MQHRQMRHIISDYTFQNTEMQNIVNYEFLGKGISCRQREIRIVRIKHQNNSRRRKKIYVEGNKLGIKR